MLWYVLMHDVTTDNRNPTVNTNRRPHPCSSLWFGWNPGKGSRVGWGQGRSSAFTKQTIVMSLLNPRGDH